MFAGDDRDHAYFGSYLMTMFRKARIDLSAIRPEKIRTAGMEALRQGMQVAQLEVAQRYASELVYVDGAGWKRIRAFGKAWKAYKARHELAALRGQASQALLKSLRSPTALVEGKSSVTLSPTRPALAGLGGRLVQSYFRHFNTQKARGSIGVISRDRRNKITKAVRKAMGDEVIKSLKGARGWWRNELLTIRLAVERMEIFG